MMVFTSADYVQHPAPAGTGEEVRDDGDQALDRRAGGLVLVVFAPGFVRPVDHERPALDVVAAQEPPVAAVLGVVAVVAHHEVLVRRHGHGTVPLAHVERRHLGGFPAVADRLEEMHVPLVEPPPRAPTAVPPAVPPPWPTGSRKCTYGSSSARPLMYTFFARSSTVSPGSPMTRLMKSRSGSSGYLNTTTSRRFTVPIGRTARS